MKYLLLLVGLVTFFAAEVALAYPSLIRLGYNGCNSCHVSPTGGGTLSPYGRSISEEISTFGGEGTGAVLGGALRATPPEGVLIGGDTRYVRIVTPAFTKSFLMQNDAELVVRAGEMTVAASAGRYAYGDDMRLESRRAYVMWQPDENWAVRAGLFMPAYGLLLPDHTLGVREVLEFGQGHETWNGEVSYRNAWGELFLTAATPKGSTVKLSTEPAPATQANTFSYIARAAAYVGKAAQVGLSYRAMMHPEAKVHHSVGAYTSVGLTRDWYVLAEADRNFEFINLGKPEDVAYLETGYEVFRGVNVQATYEYHRGSVPGIGLQLFPAPHLELLGQVKYANGQATPVLMIHSNW